MLCVASNIKLEGMSAIPDRSLTGMVVTAGAGALAAAAGMFIFKKVKAKFHRPKPKVSLDSNNHLSLSTRCTWLISELGAEADFEMLNPTEGPPPQAFLNSLAIEGPPTDSEDSEASSSGSTGGGLVHFNPYTSQDEELMEYDYDSDSSLPAPKMSLPAMVVNDDFTMIEGAALCMYLADLYQQFLPHQDFKAEYYSWITYSAATFDDLMKTLQEQLVDMPERRRNPAILEPALKGFHAFARAMSDALESRQYICGDNFTAADCVVGFTLWWAYTIEQGQLLEGYPTILAYLQRLRKRPAFKKTFGNEREWEWGRFFYTYVRGIKKS